MDNYPRDPYISITYFHSQTLAEELEKNAESLIPRLVTRIWNSQINIDFGSLPGPERWRRALYNGAMR